MVLPLTQTSTLALARAVQRNRERYERLRARGAAGAPDWLVLTAADARQAAAYRRELAKRRRRGFFPAGLRTLVLPDPPGRRIGSGGATLRALRALTRGGTRPLRERRVLILHAGGASGGLTGSDAPGRLFAALPAETVDGRPSTLFDETFVALACALERLGPCVLVGSGDVLLVFDADDARPLAEAVTGFAAEAPAEQAAHHGVYVAGPGGVVQRFLHKRDEQRLRAAGAEDALGRAWIDTGLVAFAGGALDALLALPPAGLRDPFDFYSDLVAALPAANERGRFPRLAGARRRLREQLWTRLHGLSFHVRSLSPALFAHLGTPRDYGEVVAGDGPLEAVFRAAAPAPGRPVCEPELLDLRGGFSGRRSHLEQARVHYARARRFARLASRAPSVAKALALRRDADRFEDMAFAAIGEAMGAVHWPATQADLTIAPGETVTESLPVRVDFGGGWSDTPPHSLERGGTVLNAAVLLDGQRPVRVTARALAELEIRLEARDLGRRTVITQQAEALSFRDPADPFALHKAALALRGLVRQGRRGLRSHLEQLGGGIEVVTESAVPKGSGLGTSSILGACLLSALCKLSGVRTSPPMLFEQVLQLEQMLTTGGGWQDQVGGLAPGIKLVTSPPGIPQRLRVEPVRLPRSVLAALEQRLVLVYVGRRRLAKNILRTVMGRYLAREPDVMFILGRIQDIAREMRAALTGGDLDKFGALMREHWDLNKRLDPNSTNAAVERVFSAALPFASGFKMVGAGGGGFAEIVARTARDARAMARAMPAAGGRVYPWSLAQEGA